MSAPWPGERIAMLARLRAEGLTATRCAVRLGVSRSAVCGMLFRLRHPYKPRRNRKEPSWWPVAREMRAAGSSLQDISAAVGKTLSAVSIATRPKAVEKRRLEALRWRIEREAA